MTMRFQTIRDALIALLDAGAVNFQVVGYQLRSEGETEVLNTNRTLQVFYSGGDFPKNSGGLSGPITHDPDFTLWFTVAEASTVDLSVLADPSSTDAQRATALAAKADAEYIADRAMDQMFDDVFQIIMAATSYDFDMSELLANRWIGNFRKGMPESDGQYIVIRAQASVECRTSEDVPQETPLAATDIDLALNINDETRGTEGAGTKNETV